MTTTHRSKPAVDPAAGGSTSHPSVAPPRRIHGSSAPEPDATTHPTAADSLPRPAAGDGSGAPTLTAASRSNEIGFAPRSRSWDGSAARDALQQWARGDNGEMNWSTYGRGFLYVAPADGEHTLGDFKLPFATIVDGRLVAVLAGVQAAAAAVSGARGGVDMPSSARSGVKRKINALYARARSQFGDDEIRSPFESDGQQAAGAAPAEGDVVHLTTMDGERWTPPADWFGPPALDEYTRWTVTPEGRVYGHLADWRATHIAYQGQTIPVPRSHTDYAWFHRRAIETDDGATVPVGQLTFGPGHASPSGGFQAAAQHYDATCAQGAVVRAGEDEHGIWIAGAILPHLQVPDRNEVALADVSGDWRDDGLGLELVGAHCVGTPGFLSSRHADGEMHAMAASAAAPAEPVVCLDETGVVVTVIAAGDPPAGDTDPGESTETAIEQQQGCADGVCHTSIGVQDLTTQVAEAVAARLAPTEPATESATENTEDTGSTDTDPDPVPEAESSTLATPHAESQGDSGDTGGNRPRVLAARQAMAAARMTRIRRAPPGVDPEDTACPDPNADDIDALTAALNPHDPDVMHGRVLAARIRRGSRGSLAAASAASLDRKPGTNWVEEDTKGLPGLIRRVARHIEDSGRPLDEAIPAAVNWVKHVCSTGDVENFPGRQNVNAPSRAAACRAVAEWNALKARN